MRRAPYTDCTHAIRAAATMIALEDEKTALPAPGFGRSRQLPASATTRSLGDTGSGQRRLARFQ